MRKELFKRITYCSFLLVVPALCTPAFGTELKPNNVSQQQMARNNVKAQDLLNKFVGDFGYKLKIIGKLPDKYANSHLRNAKNQKEVAATIKNIFSKIGVVNYLIEIDAKNKVAKIILLGKSGEAIAPSSPTIGDLTYGQLAKIEYDYKTRKRPDNLEITPPSSEGPALTWGELKQIKNNYKKRISDGNTDITPPSVDGPAITLSDLNSIKSAYKNRISNGNMVITPPSKEGPGLTLNELANITHNYQTTRLLSQDKMNVEVTPPSKYGPGLTMSQINDIKREYSQRINAGTTGK